MGIGDDVRRQMEKAPNAAMGDDARGLQRALACLSESCKGGDAAAARAALERAMRQHHARPTAAQLDEKARRLVNGERIGVTSSDFRLGADLPRAAAAAEEIFAPRQVVTGQAPAGRRVDGPDGAFIRASARSL